VVDASSHFGTQQCRIVYLGGRQSNTFAKEKKESNVVCLGNQWRVGCMTQYPQLTDRWKRLTVAELHALYQQIQCPCCRPSHVCHALGPQAMVHTCMYTYIQYLCMCSVCMHAACCTVSKSAGKVNADHHHTTSIL